MSNFRYEITHCRHETKYHKVQTNEVISSSIFLIVELSYIQVVFSTQGRVFMQNLPWEDSLGPRKLGRLMKPRGPAYSQKTQPTL